jgi:hypothetical protein
MAGREYSPRRAVLLGAAALVALPLTTPAPAVALPSPDAALIRLCDETLACWHTINTQAIAGDWGDEELDAECDRLAAMVAAVAAVPAAGVAGLSAKAWVVAIEFEKSEAEKDRADHLLTSLLRDLIGAAAQVPTQG